jgi:hypothetical protein
MVGFLTRRIPSWCALMMLTAWVFFAPVAGACVICFPYPKTPLADNLLQSKTVIMARERTDKPYTFYSVEVLMGAIDGSEINAFIDTTARRKLKQNSEDVVVFRQQYWAPGWLYTAYADTEYQEFIRSILEQSSHWRKLGGDRIRIDFFAERLTHSNQRIREQACLEVGRAPYTSIKRIGGTIPRRQIREFLDKWRLVEWHNLYILMLGQSRHPDDIAYIRNKLERAAAYGPWLTARKGSHVRNSRIDCLMKWKKADCGHRCRSESSLPVLAVLTKGIALLSHSQRQRVPLGRCPN